MLHVAARFHTYSGGAMGVLPWRDGQRLPDGERYGG